MVADKLPAWSMTCAEDRDRIFSEQLERTGLDYFDFYLLHSVEEGANYDTYERYDCFSWAKQKVAEGKIKHFGFSFHGSPELLVKVLDEHPEIEFVQIQLNYADWDNPVVHSGELYRILSERDLPIIVMEPVKGGKLANLEPELGALLHTVRPDASDASWALRFAGSLPGVCTILSGMSEPDQMLDNLRTFDQFEPLTEEDRDVLSEVVRRMLDMPIVPCTACRYCVDGCPMGIMIPDVLSALNSQRLYPDDNRPKSFYKNLVKRGSGQASACIACGQCEGVCPQHLPIIELLKDVLCVARVGRPRSGASRHGSRVFATIYALWLLCGRGGIGRRTRFRSWRDSREGSSPFARTTSRPGQRSGKRARCTGAFFGAVFKP